MTPFATLWLYAVGVLTAVALALSLVAIVLPPTPNACVEFPDACASVMVPLHRRPAKHDLPPAFQALVSIPRLEQYRLTRLVPGVSDRAREHGDASGGNEAANAPPALPILFVHGHRGSPDQGSALATLAANLFESADDELPGSSQVERAPFVVYSIDFDEASSAFHSTELATQAYFINECVLSVLNLHPNAPQHVVVVAHSMGGIAARIAFLMPNHVNGSVSTLITLATPHQEHPYNIDSALHSLFQASNQQWALLAAGASDDVGAAQGVLTAPASLLSNVVLVSLAGGPQDTTIRPELSSVAGLVRPSHGFSATTSAISGAWLQTSHVGIVNCGQVVSVLARALFAAQPTLRYHAHHASAALAAVHRAQVLRSLLTDDALVADLAQSAARQARAGVTTSARVVPEGRQQPQTDASQESDALQPPPPLSSSRGALPLLSTMHTFVSFASGSATATDVKVEQRVALNAAAHCVRTFHDDRSSASSEAVAHHPWTAADLLLVKTTLNVSSVVEYAVPASSVPTAAILTDLPRQAHRVVALLQVDVTAAINQRRSIPPSTASSVGAGLDASPQRSMPMGGEAAGPSETQATAVLTASPALHVHDVSTHGHPLLDAMLRNHLHASWDRLPLDAALARTHQTSFTVRALQGAHRMWKAGIGTAVSLMRGVRPSWLFSSTRGTGEVDSAHDAETVLRLAALLPADVWTSDLHQSGSNPSSPSRPRHSHAHRPEDVMRLQHANVLTWYPIANIRAALPATFGTDAALAALCFVHEPPIVLSRERAVSAAALAEQVTDMRHIQDAREHARFALFTEAGHTHVDAQSGATSSSTAQAAMATAAASAAASAWRGRTTAAEVEWRIPAGAPLVKHVPLGLRLFWYASYRVTLTSRECLADNSSATSVTPSFVPVVHYAQALLASLPGIASGEYVANHTAQCVGCESFTVRPTLDASFFSVLQASARGMAPNISNVPLSYSFSLHSTERVLAHALTAASSVDAARELLGGDRRSSHVRSTLLDTDPILSIVSDPRCTLHVHVVMDTDEALEQWLQHHTLWAFVATAAFAFIILALQLREWATQLQFTKGAHAARFPSLMQVLSHNVAWLLTFAAVQCAIVPYASPAHALLQQFSAAAQTAPTARHMWANNAPPANEQLAVPINWRHIGAADVLGAFVTAGGLACMVATVSTLLLYCFRALNYARLLGALLTTAAWESLGCAGIRRRCCRAQRRVAFMLAHRLLPSANGATQANFTVVSSGGGGVSSSSSGGSGSNSGSSVASGACAATGVSGGTASQHHSPALLCAAQPIAASSGVCMTASRAPPPLARSSSFSNIMVSSALCEASPLCDSALVSGGSAPAFVSEPPAGMACPPSVLSSPLLPPPTLAFRRKASNFSPLHAALDAPSPRAAECVAGGATPIAAGSCDGGSGSGSATELASPADDREPQRKRKSSSWNADDIFYNADDEDDVAAAAWQQEELVLLSSAAYAAGGSALKLHRSPSRTLLPAAGGLLQMDGHDPERAWMSDLSPSAAMPPRNSSVSTSLIAGASIDGGRAVRRDSYASAADIVELHTAAVPLSIPMATLVRILSWCFSGSTHTAMQYIVHDRDEVHVHSSDRMWMLPVPSAQAAPLSGGGRPGSGSVLRALRVRCDSDNILSSLVEGTCALCHTCAPPTTHCMQACGAAERENQCKGSGSHSMALLPQHRQVSGLGSCSCSACRRALQTARSPRSPCSRAAAMYSLFVAGLVVGVLYYPWLCLLGMYVGFFIRVVALAARHHSTHARKRVYEGVAGAHAALCGLVSRAASWPLLRLPPLDAAASPPPRNAVNLLRYHHIVLLLYLPVLGCKAMALLHAVETLTILPERHWTEFVLVVPMMLHMLVAREHLPFTTLPAAHTHTVACIPYCRPIRRRVCAPLRALLSFFTSLVFLVCCAGWLTFSRAHAAAYHLPSLVSFVSSCILMSHFPLALLCARPTCGAH